MKLPVYNMKTRWRWYCRCGREICLTLFRPCLVLFTAFSSGRADDHCVAVSGADASALLTLATSAAAAAIVTVSCSLSISLFFFEDFVQLYLRPNDGLYMGTVVVVEAELAAIATTIQQSQQLQRLNDQRNRRGRFRRLPPLYQSRLISFLLFFFFTH